MGKKSNQSFLFLLLCFTIISCNKTVDNNADCIPVNLQNGIIAFYPFSSGSLNDLSGNNYHLSNPTAATAGPDRAGNSNCAFSFVRSSGDFLTYVNPAFLDNFQTLPFSISIWYKPVGLNPSFEVLAGRDVGVHCPDTHGQWSVALFDNRRAVLGINERSLWDDYTAGVNTLNDLSNIWQHVVVTCNGIDLKLYRNGVLTTRTPGLGCNPPSPPTLNTGDLFLGKNFDGLLDDVIIYNRILTGVEINELYHLPACCQ